MLQALNILENFDLKSMGYNSPRYINTIYQAMSLAFADRDFYYGDTYTGPAKPVDGLLSKEYAKQRAKLINPDRNVADIKPGDPYNYQADNESVSELSRPVEGRPVRDADARTAAGATVASCDEDGFPCRRTLRSMPARHRSRPPMPKAGSSPSRRAAAGCRR